MNFENYFAIKEKRSKQKIVANNCRSFVDELINVSDSLTNFDIRNELLSYWKKSKKLNRRILPDLTEDLLTKFVQEIKKARALKKKINAPQVEKQTTGVLYLIENSSFEGWIKCGMTTNMNSRLNCYNSYDPLKRFVVVDSKEVPNIRRNEELLIHNLKMRAEIQNGEWFRISKSDAIKIFQEAYKTAIGHTW